MKRIICIGNAFAESDAAGPAVHQRLALETLPDDIELVAGGLGGIDLLGLVEGSERVAFVDAISGWGAPGEVVLLEGAELQGAAACRYEHAAGFAYLLRALPHLLKPVPVPLCLVGLELPVLPAAIEKAARLALAFVGSKSPASGRFSEALPGGEGK